ncbi:modular serine protease-like isoform X2 [Euwallacea similis]|uniref:modular serine protease-like isoform X2 n=1 Tax=Euwallacea similis TaxID=1736056 RepID=UPI0034505668
MKYLHHHIRILSSLPEIDKFKFQCEGNPSCIDTDQICDGSEDCPDASDEKQSLCQNLYCPGYLFKCDYGACISADLKCNGQRNCRDNSDEKSCSISTVAKINTNCRSDEFECNSGQCIEIDGICDGVYHCNDKSDETEYLCLNTYCPGYTYKCKYGACVDGDAECNGKQDCVDNSDEANCRPVVLPTTPPVIIDDNLHNSNSCVTPQHPANGRWFYLPNMNNQKQAAKINQKVNSGVTIGFQCNDGYKLSNSDKKEKLVYCQLNGQWNEPFPSCIKLCPAQTNRNHAIISCELEGSPIPCDKAIDQTELTFKCDPYFESDTSWTVNKCIDGSWHYPDVRCREKCGEKRVSVTPLIVGGTAVERGHYPWVVALYSRRLSSPLYSHICGGSLLSTSVAVTAAHCVTYDNNGDVIHKKFFKVASGKYYIQYEDTRDLDTAQYSDVSQIIVHQEYRGEVQKFRFDIALLKLSTPFALSKVCQPVCIEYNDVSQSLLKSNPIATVTGWGFTTAHGKPSEVLKEIDIPHVDNAQCRSELDPEFALKYLIGDKFCAGFVNSNMSVCQGDSGGGLVVKDSKNKYYIQGLVSLGDVALKNNQRTCDIERRALFTNINEYTHWIQSKMLSPTTP